MTEFKYRLRRYIDRPRSLALCPVTLQVLVQRLVFAQHRSHLVHIGVLQITVNLMLPTVCTKQWRHRTRCMRGTQQAVVSLTAVPNA